MLRYLIDTDICIYVSKNHSPILRARFELLKQGEAAISAINFGEMLFGAEKSQFGAASMARLRGFIEHVPVLPLNEDVAETYASIRAHLERKGTPIGANDLWIGAHALTLGITLITNNDKEFKRIPKLKVENWTKKS
jgi:tRNA(fMet)-specific endonuclease VapC